MDAAAAAFGLRIEGHRPDEGASVYLWPECVQSWGVWMSVQTQWSVGPSGHRIGLRHDGVLAVLRSLGYGPGKRRSLRRMHGDMLAMERAALDGWSQVYEQDRMRNKGHG